tara:strand:- start:1574 stop:1897 length:324 start_codon:yes stop_codon:yes gene_type:complete
LSKINNYSIDPFKFSIYKIALMANTKSAIKRTRKIYRQTKVNKSRKSRFKSALKKMKLLIEKKDKKEAKAFLPKLNSELMRIANTGIIKRQNASRNVSRITKKINSL